MLRYICLLSLLAFSTGLCSAPTPKTPAEICSTYGEKNKGELLQSINDVSFLNKTELSCIISPKSANEISEIIETINKWNELNPKIHISVAGARHSQGGHIASKLGITLDMKSLSFVDSPNLKNGLWTVKVGAGALWSDVHNAIKMFDGHSLANKVQQSSTPFTVGGTLSVNAHGRSFSYGSVIHSVEKITVVLPDGSITTASRNENPFLFNRVIGGYGLFGVIVDATLELHENHYLKSEATYFNSPEEYIVILDKILKDTPRHIIERDESGSIESLTQSPIAFLFATLALDRDGFMTKGTAYTYRQLVDVDRTGTVNPDPKPTLFNPRALLTKIGFWLKRKGLLASTAQKLQYKFLNTQDTHLKVLTPPIKPILAAASKKNPDLLQEYFIPVRHMPEFLGHVKEAFLNNDIKLSNASLRFIPKSTTSSTLTYESATEDQLAIVLYFSLRLNKENIDKAKIWTRDLVQKSIALDGRYYLPYQQWPSKAQFEQAYPSYKVFKEDKVSLDPNDVFSNRFYEYYLNSSVD
jgi:FAD/FMN-containing dehydrogenases